MSQPFSSIHSAVVHITLIVNERRIRVAQMGPDFLILKEAINLPPSEGNVTLVVDGSVQTFPVSFPNGLSADSKRVSFAELDVRVAA